MRLAAIGSTNYQTLPFLLALCRAVLLPAADLSLILRTSFTLMGGQRTGTAPLPVRRFLVKRQPPNGLRSMNAFMAFLKTFPIAIRANEMLYHLELQTTCPSEKVNRLKNHNHLLQNYLRIFYRIIFRQSDRCKTLECLSFLHY